ncbi:diaminopimelate decarboxylase [Pendulispora brunnea]|uniref:diaminopimelate decarboxylase n=1 Tax=Pendulispora brunnea TaxID=2905690 RepID=UPI00374E0D2E
MAEASGNSPRRDPNGRALLGGLALSELVRSGSIRTPSYVYDLDAVAAGARELREAFGNEPHLVAYAVKANTAGPIVRTLAAQGCGADVVSGAELSVALACGVPAQSIVYNGVAKRDDEIDKALGAGILSIQIESVEEIVRVAARARALGRKERARISLRINPALDFEALETHANIATGHDAAKFGIAQDDLPRAIDIIKASPEVELVGLGHHIGSQIPSVPAYRTAARTLFSLGVAVRAGGIRTLRFLDTGGGFGIDYGAGAVPKPGDYVRAALEERKAAEVDDLMLMVEPGRSMVAAHGVLISRVVQTKVSTVRGTARRWLMIDAGMNDLIRPALYQARHRVVPLDTNGASADFTATLWRVVGPVCESSDDFGVHALPDAPPEHVALLDAGAYGYVMSNQYNGRALPDEVFLRGGQIVSISRGKSPDDWVQERVAIQG